MPFRAVNPATEEVLGEYPSATPAQIEAALADATAGFARWRRTSFADRAHLMVRAAELLEGEIPVVAELLTSEMGKPFHAAKGEVAKCAMVLRYYAEHAEAMMADEPIATSATRSGVRYDPTGPVLAIMPWNFPLWQVLRFVAPCVMAGNVALVKHAPNVPGCAAFIEALFTRAGFGPGVVTNLYAEVGALESIIADPRVAGVTLTGSEGAGRAVAAIAGRNLKKCILELGGSDAFVVGESADLDLAVPMAVSARIQNNGQACIAAKRFVVVRSRAEEFVDRFAAAMAEVVTGDPMDFETELGPLATRTQRDLLAAQVADSLAAGARALVGGVVPEGRGFYYPATVLVDVPADSRSGGEELFGPVAVVRVVDDLAEALSVANDVPFGLGGSIWSNDPAEIDAAIDGLETGLVFANALVASLPELPFGGTKNSGIGRELSLYGLREFANVKSFYVA